MKNATLTKVFLAFTIFLYGSWSILELALKPRFGIDEFTREVLLKTLLWLLPSIFLISRLNKDLYIQKKEMLKWNRKRWITFPLLLLFTIYLLADRIIEAGRLAISPDFTFLSVVEVISIALSEEFVFRGFFQNILLTEMKKSAAILIDALMFLVIHFPAWIESGFFISAFTSGAFLTIMALSIIFSLVFIRAKSIWPPVILHFWWDFLLFLF